MGRSQAKVIIIAIAIFILSLLLFMSRPDIHNERVIIVPNGILPHAFRAYWKDKYTPIADPPHVPWAQGPTKQQQLVIEKFDQAWIATIESPIYRQVPTKSERAEFHTKRIIAFRPIEDSSEIERLRNALIECSRSQESRKDFPPEGSPGIALRLKYDDEVCDLLIERSDRISFIYDKHDLVVMFIPSDSLLPTVVSDLALGLPSNPLTD